MKILWSILCIGALLPAVTNATEYNINNDGKQEIFLACDDGNGVGKGKVYANDSVWNLLWSKDTETINVNSESKPVEPKSKEIGEKYKEIGIGISGSIFKSIQQYENSIEGWNPVVSGKIFYRAQNHHLSCLFSYYPLMYTTYIRRSNGGAPISITYYLGIWECNLIPAIFEYDFKGISFSFGNGIIIGYGVLYSKMAGEDVKYLFSYPSTFGTSLNISFTSHIKKNISINFDINAKHYVLMKSNEPSFKMEGISGGLGVEYHFPIQKRR